MSMDAKKYAQQKFGLKPSQLKKESDDEEFSEVSYTSGTPSPPTKSK
jgi:hypothetical protein